MIGNPFAGLARVGWMEFWSHLKSPRLLVLVILFALVVFGASYGLSQTSNPGFFNTAMLHAHPAIRNESGTNHYLIVAWDADERGTPQPGKAYSIYTIDFRLPGAGRQLLANVSTNASGWFTYDVGTTQPLNLSYDIETAAADPSSASPREMAWVAFDPSLTSRTFTLSWGTSTSSGPFGTETVFFGHVVTTAGYPATAANVYVNDSLVGHPDGNGYIQGSLSPGDHILRFTYNGYDESYSVAGQPSSGPVYENGADYVLLMVSQFFGLLLPIASIAVSFDAVARERAQGSLEVLLARKVQREGILAGKFLGAFAAVALPVVAVLLAGAGILTSVSGVTPSGAFVAVLIASSLFLVAVYILLMLIFSTLAKSVGTAVVFGVVLWLFFNLVFTFLSLFLVISSGGSLYDPGTYRLLLTVQLLNPNTVFQMLVSLAIPSSGGSAGFLPAGYVSIGTVALAGVAWVAILLVLALVVFRKRAES